MLTNPSVASRKLGIVTTVGLVVLALSCHSASRASADPQPSAQPAPKAVTAAKPSSGAAATAPSEQLRRHTAAGRVVAIGDLHGDLDAARRAFRVAKVLDENEQWVGGNTVVVQTGDVLDRGQDERPLLEWLEKIAILAQQGGGALHRINGNHEIMNVAGDLRYVSESGFTSFAEYAQGPIPGPLGDAPAAQRGRLMAFLPGGPWARRLAQYPVVLQVNDSVFAHGGVVPKHLEYGLERMNAEVSSWMRGTKPLPRALVGDDTPFWDRTYGETATDADCERLQGVLAKLGAKRLVVGHTPQRDGVTFACDGRVARIDVGLSRYYGGHSTAVLEIQGSSVRVLTEKDLATSTSKPHRPNADRGRAKGAPELHANP